MKINAKVRPEQSHMHIHTKKDMNLHVDKEIVINARVIKVKTRTEPFKQKEEAIKSRLPNKKQIVKVGNRNQRKVIHVSNMPMTNRLTMTNYIRKENIVNQFYGHSYKIDKPFYINKDYVDYVKRIRIVAMKDQDIIEDTEEVKKLKNLKNTHKSTKNKTSAIVMKTVIEESILEDIEGARDVYNGVQQVSQPIRRINNTVKTMYQYQKAINLVKYDKRNAAKTVKVENEEYYIKGGKRVKRDINSGEKHTEDKNHKAKDTHETKGNTYNSSYNVSPVKKEKRAENLRQYQKLRKQRMTKFAMAKLRSPIAKGSGTAESDSIVKLATDLVKMKAMHVVRQAVTGLAALVAPVMIPILGFGFIILVAITALYESPLAIFLPKIEPYEYGVECDDERSPHEVIEEYSQELDAEIAQQYASYDEYSVTYSPEDSFVGSNSTDILYAYMIKCGEDNDSLVMTDDNKELLSDIFTTMCSYSTKTSTRTVTVENTEGQENSDNQDKENSSQDSENTSDNNESTTKTINVIDVKVKIQDLENYLTDNPLTSEENEWYTTLMEEDPNDFSDDEETNLDGITVEGIPSEIGTQVAELALTKVGCEYSQSRRWEEGVYDCSSLVYRCYQQYGITLGASTAAGEAKWLTDKKCYFTSSDKLQAGDLIFYSSNRDNGRYRNISHVAIYIGNGQQVEAQDPSRGVRCNPFRSSNINCYARPSLLLESNKN